MLKPSSNRRSFLHSATAFVAGAGLAHTSSQAEHVHQGPITRRWTEQRWTLDNTIRSVGMDWDQPRSIYLSAPCGPAAAGDFLMVRQRIQKYADAAPAFEAQARRREAQAKVAEAANELVNARDNYFIASVHWGSAQWPIDENNEQNKFYNQRKRECYQQYAKLADHKVEEVWIPMPASVGGKSLPGWLHLPPDYKGGKIPVVINVPGMDSFKEIGTFLYGDKFLTRGIAVLNIDGPGQYESAVLDIHFSMPAWIAHWPLLTQQVWRLKTRSAKLPTSWWMSNTRFTTTYCCPPLPKRAFAFCLITSAPWRSTNGSSHFLSAKCDPCCCQ